MTVLSIQVLGDLTVVCRGETVSLPPSRKTRALLAYLAVTGRTHRCERLCELLWEVPDDPKGALRWSLSKLRSSLGAEGASALLADRNTIRLTAELTRVDSTELLDAAAKGFDGIATADLEALALGIRGTFLEDLSMPNCAGYEAWRVAMADQLDQAARRLLETLTRRLSDEPERARRFAKALRMITPDDGLRASEALALSASPTRTSAAVDTTIHSGSSPSARTTIDVRYCTSKDGTRIAYSVGGGGPLLVRGAHWLSHIQFDAETLVWRHWINALHQRFTFLRYDERGNGLSDWNVHDLSFETMIGDLETVVDAAGFQTFSLIGISQGAAFSIAYAVRHPERVRRLILYGGFARGVRKRGNPREMALRDALETLLRDGWSGSNPIFRNMFVHRFVPKATMEHVSAMTELQRMTMSPENALALSQMASNIDVSELLPLVRVPTLVVHAREDRIAPFESGLDLAARIPGARFVPLESDNHILLHDEVAFARFLEAIDAFCAEEG